MNENNQNMGVSQSNLNQGSVQSSMTTPQQPIAPQSVNVQPTNPQPVNPQSAPQPATTEPQKPQSNKGLIALLLLVVLAFSGYVIYKEIIQKDPKEGTSEKEEEKESETEPEKEETKEEEYTIDSPLVQKLFNAFNYFTNGNIHLTDTEISNGTKASIAYYNLDEKDIVKNGDSTQFSAEALRKKVKELFGQNTSYEDVKGIAYGVLGKYPGKSYTYYELDEATDMYISYVDDNTEGIGVTRRETLIAVKQEENKLILTSSANSCDDSACVGNPYYEYEYTFVKEQSTGNYIFQSKKQTKYDAGV